MYARPYLLAAAVALLAACSDSTGPDLSTTGKAGTSTRHNNGDANRPPSAHPVTPR
jgi:hypothetical protein